VLENNRETQKTQAEIQKKPSERSRATLMRARERGYRERDRWCASLTTISGWSTCAHFEEERNHRTPATPPISPPPKDCT